MANLTTLDDTSNETQLSTLIGMIAIPLWSVSIGFIRSVSEIFGPVAGAAMIYTTSGILGALVLGLPRFRELKRPGIWYSGLLFVAYEISLALAIGLAHNRDQALELGMINYLWPSVTILFAVLTRQQRGSWLLAVALGFCLLGIGWVMKGDNELSLHFILQNIQDNPLAYIYAFAAALLWGLYSVVTRHFDSGKSAVPFYFLATAAVLWIKYTISDGPALVLHWNGLGQIVIFSAMSAAAYACWNRGVCRGNISLLATASYFTPVLAAILTCLWLGIRPSIGFFFGVSMITAGSLLCWWATRRQAL
ncbi:aromatic amino acid DMT transporter YddG [Brucella rhizosphaerae]|uniref:EamA-like transporter family protein n=1 Tax=Brucella rhizosphaerae TaxID=571254 RepID=A0A256FUS7_9HYPH|nr:aromatic amino acid DMT transporter YddG [Brucella rhizosphaerae]OYR18573.1 eamA-like transporter family protein [Brucella rhizosphaerae]